MMHVLTESLGYLATVFLAISLSVSNDIRFRWINSCGSITFVLYGILISAYPIILTNALLACINFVYLYKLYNYKENFELMEFKSDYQITQRFVRFYKKDIHDYFPEYVPNETWGNLQFIVLRDMVIANMFIAELNEDGIAYVKLNYTVPKYRDFKIGKFLFEKEKQYLIDKGVKQIRYTKVYHRLHERFLKRTGFTTEMVDGRLHYIKNL